MKFFALFLIFLTPPLLLSLSYARSEPYNEDEGLRHGASWEAESQTGSLLHADSGNESMQNQNKHKDVNIVQMTIICIPTEVAALITLKSGLVDHKGCFSSWDPYSVDPCTWLHIQCNTDKKVKDITLQSCGLSGSLLPGILALKDLKQLQSLHIFSNNLTGPIPEQFRFMPELTVFSAFENQLTGSISPWVFDDTKLEIVQLDWNKYSGSLPQIWRPSSLREFSLSYNDFSGHIPGSLRGFPASCFEGNPKVCGPPLNKSC